MPNINKELHDLFAEARAIRLALEHNSISYKEAQQRVKPLLEKLNAAGAKIAQKVWSEIQKDHISIVRKQTLVVAKTKVKFEAKIAKNPGVSATKCPHFNFN